MLPVLRYFLKKNHFCIAVGTKISCIVWKNIKSKKLLTFNVDSKHPFKKAKYITNIIKNHNPDAIITGISPGYSSVENKIIKSSKNIPKFSYQDFPGDCNYNAKTFADFLFVLNKKAKKLSSKYYNNNKIFVVGDPKKCQITKKSIKKWKKSFYKKYKLNSKVRVIGFLGQPLWKCSGYRESILFVQKLFFKKIKSFSFFYRPHPSENKKNLLLQLKMIKEKIPQLKVDYCFSPYPLMACAQYIFTCYSSLGVEFPAFSRCNYKANQKFICIMINKKIRNKFLKQTKLKKVPFVENKTIFEIKNEKKIPKNLFLKKNIYRVKSKQKNSCLKIYKKVIEIKKKYEQN